MEDDVLIEYSAGSVRYDDAQANKSWRICADGRCYSRRNPPGIARPVRADPFWFVEDYPRRAAKTLTGEQLEALTEYIAGLSDLPARLRYEAERVQGGSWHKLEIRTPEGRRVVLANGPYRDKVDELLLPVLRILRPDYA
ncbi:MAG: hypothetical protein H6739_24775 [Alphaproteobacteria bacterium]|nr:hypothetical protein [Alphaproteobacteria bacterium]